MMAFFIMKTNYFILFLFSFISSFHSFDSEDWFFISEPNIIKSITQDSFNIYFLSDTGVYSYDFITEDFFYNINLSQNINSEEKHIIHYSSFTDYFFIITQNHILYRSSVSSYWNERRLSDFGINSFDYITKIGFFDNYIIFKTENTYQSIDVYSMSSFDDEIDYMDQIVWIHNNVKNLDLSSYYTFDNSLVREKSIRDISGRNHYVVSSMYDNSENLWLGMNTGAIYRTDNFSYNIERLSAGPRVEYVSDIYKDSMNNWYFFDSYFKRTGRELFENDGYFLSIWHEKNNEWTHIPKNENILINHAIINDIQRLDQFILFSTFNGLLIYDIDSNFWYQHYKFMNSGDKIIWKTEFNDNYIFFASSSGLIICDYIIIDNVFEIHRNKIIMQDSEIYDIDIFKNNIYFSSSQGIFEYVPDLKKQTLLDPNIYYDINVLDSYILASNKNLWYIDNEGRELLSNNINYFSVTSSGDRICATDFNEVKIINFNSGKEWYLNLDKLNINEPIYSLDCDDNWLWFSNSRGVSFFDWTDYEE